MAAPEPYLLDPASYPMRTEIGLRYSDLDVNRHLNNVKLIDLLQEGRGHLHRQSGMTKADASFTIMVANLNVQFLGEAFYPEPVVCHSGLRAIGRTSQTVAQLAVQGERPVAYAETVMVTMLDGKAAPHPEHYRGQLEPWLIAS
ncbi:MAG: acyl-CoA thioesterase [Novosphingobium sp.]|nr:acyl-CoA thioesterase [Novosphingobium sp.]